MGWILWSSWPYLEHSTVWCISLAPCGRILIYEGETKTLSWYLTFFISWVTPAIHSDPYGQLMSIALHPNLPHNVLHFQICLCLQMATCLCLQASDLNGRVASGMCVWGCLVFPAILILPCPTWPNATWSMTLLVDLTPCIWPQCLVSFLQVEIEGGIYKELFERLEALPYPNPATALEPPK